MKWVLIMIFFANPHDYNVASSAHSIVFESREACLAAARATHKATNTTTFCEPTDLPR